MKELDSRKAPPLPKDKVAEQVEKMKVLTTYYTSSAPVVKAIQWGGAAKAEAGTLAAGMKEKVSAIYKSGILHYC